MCAGPSLAAACRRIALQTRSPYRFESPPVAMLRLAIGGHPAIESVRSRSIAARQLHRDTLAGIHTQQPDAELFLLMGADALADLPQWREAGRICELAFP